ncbi:MAG TPA: TIGR03086 family metal-binding protein [Acidimicrobiales bacterium]|nr:TIGR03086 family metal-binding protein [Acidimicrobiales bacterium]
MSEQSAAVDLLARAFEQSSAVVSAVTPEQMTGPTPCPAFDVRTLVGHMLFAADRIGAAGRRTPLPEDGPAVTGLADGEWGPAFDKAASEALTAWAAAGAFDGDIALPFGTFPAAMVVGIYTLEQVAHAWDLAVATGASHLLDESLAAAILPFAEQTVMPDFRGEGPEAPFGYVVDVPADADAVARLAGFMGRNPTWAA